MAVFETAYYLTRKVEGEYAHHKSDRGGETYAGIARNKWPKWQGWALVDVAKSSPNFPANLITNVTLQVYVLGFYRKYFWDRNSLGLIKYQNISNELFDTGVNLGVGTAANILQEALNLTNVNGTKYKDIEQDSKVGPITINTTNNHPKPDLLLKVLNILQAERYLKILRSNPSQEIFATSWFNRVHI